MNFFITVVVLISKNKCNLNAFKKFVTLKVCPNKGKIEIY